MQHHNDIGQKTDQWKNINKATVINNFISIVQKTE